LNAQLNKKYRKLGSAEVPITNMLFGNDLKSACANIDTTSKMGLSFRQSNANKSQMFFPQNTSFAKNWDWNWRPATKDTIARWLKTVLIHAGITNFAPQGFRGASSSAVLKSGVAVQDILKVAGWSKVSTFKRFYNKFLGNEDRQTLF